MSRQCTAFDDLPRPQLLVAALETMHVGHLLDRALMPQLYFATNSFDAVDQVAIDEWMGASPVYVGRMRRLMRIEGDTVPAIVKALQLDCGFPHQYMDVAWTMIDDLNAQFYLRHCGALLDVEPYGEESVRGMCHTIEDPTFDATDRVLVVLEPQSGELLDVEHPGWVGLVARGAGLGIETAAQGVDARARLASIEVRDGRVVAELTVLPGSAPAAMPKAAQFMSVSGATTFQFDTSAERLGR